MFVTSKISVIVVPTHRNYLLPKTLVRQVDVRLRPVWIIEITSGDLYGERPTKLNVNGHKIGLTQPLRAWLGTLKIGK